MTDHCDYVQTFHDPRVDFGTFIISERVNGLNILHKSISTLSRKRGLEESTSTLRKAKHSFFLCITRTSIMNKQTTESQPRLSTIPGLCPNTSSIVFGYIWYCSPITKVVCKNWNLQPRVSSKHAISESIKRGDLVSL